MITEQERREIAIGVAKSYLGTAYRWGGDDPSGFDCSGLMIECLQSVGVLPRGRDFTAAMIWDRFPKKIFDQSEVKAGDLVFWKVRRSSRIIHIEMMINGELAIGASGGGSKTKTLADAWRGNAYVKIRPANSRAGIAGFINPYQRGYDSIA